MSGQRIPVLWFDSRGCGPDEFALELHPFAADVVREIPAFLGIRVRSGELVLGSFALVDGGFNLARESVSDLHSQLGAWLEENPASGAWLENPTSGKGVV